MRTHFDNQLIQLHNELIYMGALCEQSIAMVTKALAEGNIQLAAQAKAHAAGIDQVERDIEALCLRLLLHQQPVAGDLRQISAALKMITDMERIGDQAEDIADIIPFLRGSAAAQHSQISAMAEATVRMVSDSIDAYIKQDTALAEAVIAHDDIVDEHFDLIKKALIAQIATTPSEGEAALDLVMIAKYFERIGDHATNIAEWVIFSVTGRHKQNE